MSSLTTWLEVAFRRGEGGLVAGAIVESGDVSGMIVVEGRIEDIDIGLRGLVGLGVMSPPTVVDEGVPRLQ
jgi:hypothetical protein